MRCMLFHEIYRQINNVWLLYSPFFALGGARDGINEAKCAALWPKAGALLAAPDKFSTHESVKEKLEPGA